jgi:polar amino acid transport system permease protein
LVIVQSLLRVINVLPDLVSTTIEVAKLTSIASVASFAELLYSAGMARSVAPNIHPVVRATIMDIVVLRPLMRLLSRLEYQVASH